MEETRVKKNGFVGTHNGECGGNVRQVSEKKRGAFSSVGQKKKKNVCMKCGSMISTDKVKLADSQ